MVMLLKSYCKEFRDPACTVFAARVADGVKRATDFPPLDADNQRRLEEYMSRFNFDV
jgi:hypothetical protein